MPRRRARILSESGDSVADYKHTINLPADRLPDEGRSRPARARHAEARGKTAACTEAARGRRAAGRASCCTTARRTPTATSTSATRSTRSSRTSRQVAHAGRLRLAVHPGLGLPRPAHRAAGGEEARPPRRRSSTRTQFRAACRAFAQAQIEQQRDGLQAPRRARRLGPSLSHDGPAASRRSRSARSARSSATGTSTRA